jgi:shikimate dehydrogenase
MHNAAIAALGLDAVYVAARTTDRAFPALVHALLAAGGALNVTVPFKRLAAGVLKRPSEAVRRTGACNTIWGEADAPQGDNTDVDGVRAAARALLPDSSVRRVLLVGTGGSARAAAAAVADEWPGVVVAAVSRDAAHASEFRAWAEGAGIECEPLREPAGAADLMVNATPLGLAGDDPLPVSFEVMSRMKPAAALDLVYARGETAWVRAARSVGARAADGRQVLVSQGAAAFERFFGVSAPLMIMRAAVEDALRP